MIMTGLLRCTRSDTCQAAPGCHRPPRFQAHLDGDQRIRLPRQTEACTSHLGAMVQAMTSWARDHGLTETDLLIVTIDPLPGAYCPGPQPQSDCAQADGLIFSTIHLGA
jgi:hypothetical protein